MSVSSFSREGRVLMSVGVRGIQTPHWPSILNLASSVFFAKIALSFTFVLSAQEKKLVTRAGEGGEGVLDGYDNRLHVAS